MSRLVAALALAVYAVATVADGAVHADLLARVVLALGGAQHGGCQQNAQLYYLVPTIILQRISYRINKRNKHKVITW